MSSTWNRTRNVVFCLVIAFLGINANAQPKMGAAGDSLLDEHYDQSEFGQNLGYSQNGFELMVQSGRIDAGPTGTWGGTRNDGYEYNWALAGATTNTLVEDNQHTNLASQIAVAGIAKAVLVIGANDLFPFPPSTGSSAYQAIYDGTASPQQIDTIASEAVANVALAAQTLKDAGVDLIVATAPDYGIAPFTKFFYTNPVKRALVDDVVEGWNAVAVARLTQDVHVPVVDIYQLSKDIWGDHGSENATFQLGGVDLNLNGTGGVDFTDVLLGNPYTPTSDTVDAFVHDGIHPNTTIGGIFANLFMTGFNQEHGDEFLLFTEEQLLQNAGSSLGGMYASDTLSASLGGKTYSDYVHAAVPELTSLADFDEDGDVDSDDYLFWRLGFGTNVGDGNIAPRLNGNANGDQFIDAADYTIWRDNYGEGVTTGRVSIPVPEPTSLGLVVLATSLLPLRFVQLMRKAGTP